MRINNILFYFLVALLGDFYQGDDYLNEQLVPDCHSPNISTLIWICEQNNSTAETRLCLADLADCQSPLFNRYFKLRTLIYLFIQKMSLSNKSYISTQAWSLSTSTVSRARLNFSLTGIMIIKWSVLLWNKDGKVTACALLHPFLHPGSMKTHHSFTWPWEQSITTGLMKCLLGVGETVGNSFGLFWTSSKTPQNNL